MWLWIVSFLILAASVIFALYVFFSNYKINPVKSEFPSLKSFRTRKILPASKQQLIASLKLKLQNVENNSLLYFNELKRLQERIQALEKNNNYKPSPAVMKDEEEDWQDLYYKLYDEKEKMENELDFARQSLERAELKLMKAAEMETEWKEKQSEFEIELNKSHTLQNKIGDLERQLAGAANRENDLAQQLEENKKVQKDLELLQQEYLHTQSEADELRNRIQDINSRDVLLQQKINRLTELESTIEISEYEKMDLRKSVEEIIVENEALAAKLQELQEKLQDEKYV